MKSLHCPASTLRRLILIGVALALSVGATGCGGRGTPSPNRAFYGITGQVTQTVTRAETLEIAEAYLNHQWFATRANEFHGDDAQGIRVDTPDAKFHREGIRPGWWVPGQWNVGVPYQWGGFSSLEEFDAGVRAGRPAGDVYTELKRERLDDAVSQEPVGIDCSGFISRCWKLSRSFSTRELPLISDSLSRYDELRPGDILNLHNSHVLLFAGWANPQQTRLTAYEAGSPPTWKVLRNEIPVEHLQALGYKPYRYQGIRD